MYDMVSATCTVNKGDLPIDLYWTTSPEPASGRKLTTNDGILITKTAQRITMLSIESVDARHRANYTCVARNSAGILYHTTELRVNGYYYIKFLDVMPIIRNFLIEFFPVNCFRYPTFFTYHKFLNSLMWGVLILLYYVVLPQIVPFDFGDESINELDMVSASCTVNKGDLPIDIIWTNNDVKLFSNDGIVISRTNKRMSVLSIESVRARHVGNYTCIATNSAGVVQYSAELAVNGMISSAAL